MTRYVATNGTLYAYWARGGYWDTTATLEGNCFLDEDDANDVLRSFNSILMEDDTPWFIREASIEIAEAS